jgi:hypothetical protein
VQFSNFECLRAIISGAQLFNHLTNLFFQALYQLKRIFHFEEIQESIGYVHSSIHGTGIDYPAVSQAKLAVKNKVPVPTEVTDKCPNHQCTQMACMYLDPIHLLFFHLCTVSRCQWGFPA